MPTARRYPNSVGRALMDKADRGRTRHHLKWTRLRRTIKMAHITMLTKLNGAARPQLYRYASIVAHSNNISMYSRPPRVTHAHVPRRCCQPNCGHRRLPYSNQCAQHAMYSVDQTPFKYCSQPQCSHPVFDLGLEPCFTNGSRCAEHLAPKESILAGGMGSLAALASANSGQVCCKINITHLCTIQSVTLVLLVR
jgi:hypothetical protein